MFSYVSPEERVPANHPLRSIRKLTDRVLEGLSATFDAMYSPIGRRSVAPEKLLRALREGRDEVRVDPVTARRARVAVQRMIAIGRPGGGE